MGKLLTLTGLEGHMSLPGKGLEGHMSLPGKGLEGHMSLPGKGLEGHMSLPGKGLEGHMSLPCKGLEGYLCPTIVTLWWRHCDMIYSVMNLMVQNKLLHCDQGGRGLSY